MFTSAARAFMNFIGRVSGIGAPPEHALFDVRNEAAQERERVKTIHLMPVVLEDEQRLEFLLPPKYKGNLMAFLNGSFDKEDGERLIIAEVTRLSYANDLNEPLHFVLEKLFDLDEDTDAIRSTVDKAVETDTRPVLGTPRQPLPQTQQGKRIVASGTQTRRAGKNMTDNRNDALSHDDSGKMKEELAAAAATDDEEDSVSRLMKKSTPVPGAKPRPQQQQKQHPAPVQEEIDSVTVRGQNMCRNQTERRNELSLGQIEGDQSILGEPRLLYRASASDQIIRWFAGQDGSVMITPSQISSVVNTRPGASNEERAARPTIDLAIFPEDHTLVMFIKMFYADLEVTSDEMSLLHGDRGSMQPSFWSVDLALVERARRMILYVIYAQMYYTTMQSTRLTRRVTSEEQDYALLQSVAAKWGLPRDPETKQVKDWPQGAYRPVVSITLRVKYFVVRRVEKTAALLQRQSTQLKKK